MFRITSENELLGSFRAFEREEVELPRGVSFPILVKDYFAWTESSGAKTYLLFSDVGKKPPLGVVFRRENGGAIGMCDWCHSIADTGKIDLLSATATERRRVAVYVCRDLSCKEKIHGVPGSNDFPKASSERERVRAVLQKMSQFVRQNLF